MSKKRVHELAKQLKDSGIELSNQELVEKLHALGYDVKSHSSSLEEDQSQSAYERIVAEKKPKAAAPRPTGPGFVVRKRAHVEPAPARVRGGGGVRRGGGRRGGGRGRDGRRRRRGQRGRGRSGAAGARTGRA